MLVAAIQSLNRGSIKKLNKSKTHKHKSSAQILYAGSNTLKRRAEFKSMLKHT